MDPLELFGTDAWKVLTDVANVYEKEKLECVKNIKFIDFEYDKLETALIEYRCEKCESGLIDVVSQVTDIFDAKFKCRSCSRIWDFVSIVGQVVFDYFSARNRLSRMSEMYPIIVTCPTCDLETYVLKEDKCFVCGETANLECQLCGELILDGGAFCSYCSHERD